MSTNSGRAAEGAEAANVLGVLRRLVAVAVVDAHDHGVIGLDLAKGGLEGLFHPFGLVAEAPRGQDLDEAAERRIDSAELAALIGGLQTC